jgi:uncharacterized protein YjbI with pentapeptide repeats
VGAGVTTTISSTSSVGQEGSVSDTRDEGVSDSDKAWQIRERQLREEEVAAQRRATWLQSFTAVAAVIAASAAIWISLNAREAIDVAKDSVERQAEENRIGTAVGAINSDGPVAQRLAALTLLRRQAIQKLENANDSDATDAERRDALNLFRSTLKTLESYIREPVGFTRPDPWAVGDTQLPRDVHSVGFDVTQMLTRKFLFNDVRGHRGELSELDRELPQLDLNYTSLYGVNLGDIDMSWLSANDFHGIDLRRATIPGSRWQGTKLHDAYLRCANLTNAHFNKRGANATNLSNADMRRANLSKADLRDANLESVNLEGANLDGAKVAGANFSGANLDGGALNNAVGRAEAKGLGDLQEPPPPSETETDPECEASWWTK